MNPSLVSGLSYPCGIAVSGSNLYVTEPYSYRIGEYTMSGAAVNRSLVSGLTGNPWHIAVQDVPEPSSLALLFSLLAVGSFLLIGYAWRRRRASIHKVITIAFLMVAGAVLSSATARAQSIYVTNLDTGTIGKYTTSGTVVNASLVSGLGPQPEGIAVSGSNLFVGSDVGWASPTNFRCWRCTMISTRPAT